MKKLLFLFILIALQSPIYSQIFQEFDIEPIGMSNPHDFVLLNDKLIFWAYTDLYGEELWVFDSTTQNVSLLKDIWAGTQGSYAGYPEAIIYQNRLFFTANDSIHGLELWATDGTTNGTVLLKDISAGIDSASPGQFSIYNNELYFSAKTLNEGTELWKTDGTSNGTVLVKDIFAGTDGSYPNNFVVCNNFLFFSAYDATHGAELWKTDGTANGTILVKDITNDSTDGFPYYPMLPFCLNQQLIFVGQTPQQGIEIFKSDGTETGTQLVKDIHPGTEGCYPFYGQILNNMIIFSADDGINGQELWKTDGTNAGTQLLKDIFPGSTGSYPHDLFVADSIVVFVAENSNNNQEVWKTNGSQTVLLKDIKSFGSSFPEKFFVFKNKMYFTAEDNTNGKEIWISDGTTSGTQLLKNLNSHSGTGSFPNSFTFHNDRLFFIADIGAVNNENYQLFQSDGTPSGTTQIQPANVQDPFNLLYYPFFFTSTPFGLFFKAQYNPQNGYELWRYYDIGTSKNTPLQTSSLLKCFPNPFNDFVQCDCESGELINLYSLEGKLLESITVTSKSSWIKISYPFPIVIQSKKGFQILIPDK